MLLCSENLKSYTVHEYSAFHKQRTEQTGAVLLIYWKSLSWLLYSGRSKLQYSPRTVTENSVLKCGSLDVSQPYAPPQPVTGIDSFAFSITFVYIFMMHFHKTHCKSNCICLFVISIKLISNLIHSFTSPSYYRFMFYKTYDFNKISIFFDRHTHTDMTSQISFSFIEYG
jgi:hypothetical protein